MPLEMVDNATTRDLALALLRRKGIRLEILRVDCTLHALTPANACSCQAVQCLYDVTHATRMPCCRARGQRDTRPRTMLLSSGTGDTIARIDYYGKSGKLPGFRSAGPKVSDYLLVAPL